MRIALHFAPQQPPIHRARLQYAFRLFCAIYGHEPLLDSVPAITAHLTISYEPLTNSAATLQLTSAYVARPTHLAAPSPTPYSRDDEDTALLCSRFPRNEPDWLGEIFEWVSSADEYSVKARDSVGRVPFSASYVGRHHLNPQVPYAAIAMRFLQRAINRTLPRSPVAPVCPSASSSHLIVNTHDVDLLPVSRTRSFQRLTKNALLSLGLYKSPGLAVKQAGQAARLALGSENPLDQVPGLAHRERAHAVGGSYYFLCHHGHRRDGNYSVAAPGTLSLMRDLQPQLEVGVHGSYRSLENSDGLASEFNCLRALGFDPLGGRQHWLRFTMPQLIHAVEHANAAYDSSIGWSQIMGYRAGACFAYPPYNFEREGPANFLEIPLVVMDSQVCTPENGDDDGLRSVSKVLAASRRYGWGGIALLWHPTAFGGVQWPEYVGEVFWSVMKEGLEKNDTWMSAASFMKTAWPRYAASGLLPKREFL